MRPEFGESLHSDPDSDGGSSLRHDYSHGGPRYNEHMAFIEIIGETKADGKLGELYDRYANTDGSVDNVLKLHSLSPDALQAHVKLYEQAMHKASPLSRIEREVIAVGVSRLNDCHY